MLNKLRFNLLWWHGKEMGKRSFVCENYKKKYIHKQTQTTTTTKIKHLPDSKTAHPFAVHT